MSPEEEGRHQSHQADSIKSPNNVFDPDTASPGCVTGGQPFVTNIVVIPQGGTNCTVQLDIQGGTNGVFYDLYTLTNLQSTFAASDWTWLAQVLTCNHYIFSNQPANAAFYFATFPGLTSGVAWGDNTCGESTLPGGVTNPIAVSAGGQFSLALLNNGTVLGWGNNAYGQTNPPAGLSNVTAIAAGQYHGVALLATGAATNWGSFWDGQHYVSVTNTNICTLPPRSNVVAIAAGIQHDIALLTNGTVVTWGMTNALANYAATNLTNVEAVGCGWEFNAALLSNGTVTAWGFDLFNQTNVPPGLSNVVSIAVGPQHTLALLSNGTVQAWGDGFSGDTNVPAGLSNVVSLAAGGSQSMALQQNGALVAWGTGSTPVGVTANKEIACGFNHTIVIRSGQLIPLITQQPTNTFCLTSGTAGFSVIVASVGGLQYQWQFDGTNVAGMTTSSYTITNANSSNVGTYDVVLSSTYGSVTSSAVTFALVLVPQLISPLAASPTWFNYQTNLAVEVAAAGQSAGFPLSYSWQLNGANISGASNATYLLSTIAAANEGTYTVTVTNAAGSTNASFTELLALPGMVETWGSDGHGESDRPVSLTNAVGVAAGEYQTLAVTDGGSVVQWGNYTDGTIFYPVSGTNVISLPPSSNVVAVAAGMGQALALMSDGTVSH